MSENSNEYMVRDINSYSPEETPPAHQISSTELHHDVNSHCMAYPDLTPVFVSGAIFTGLVIILLVARKIIMACIFSSGKPPCNLLSLCVLAPVFCTDKTLADVSREIIVTRAQGIAWMPGSSRLDGHQGDNITWALHSQAPVGDDARIDTLSRVSPDSGFGYEPSSALAYRERTRLFVQIQFRQGGDWQDVLRLTDMALANIAAGIPAGGHFSGHQGYTWRLTVN